MPHFRNIQFQAAGHFEFVTQGEEEKAVPISDSKAELVAHYGYTFAKLYNIHLRLSEIFFNYRNYNEEVRKEIFDINVVKFVALFKSDSNKVRLKADKIFNTEQMKLFRFIEQYRDGSLCHDNFFSEFVSYGITIDKDNEARELIWQYFQFSWINHKVIQEVAHLALFVHDWIKEKDKIIHDKLIKDINDGIVKLKKDQTLRINFESANWK